MSAMIRSMEGLNFASVLHLNMGYYHIKLDADAQNVGKIVFPWNTENYKYNTENYKYKRLPISIKIA
jgi:hypothetical protein